MRRFLVPLLLSCVAFAPLLRAQQTPGDGPGSTPNDVSDRIVRNEEALKARLRELRPIIEVYIQGTVPDSQLGSVPSSDEYFLGRFDWHPREGPKLRTLTPGKGSRTAWLVRPFMSHYVPDAFAAMGAPDWGRFDLERYAFTFVRREFLGEVRTLVYDVQPRSGAREGFSGRIWVEDRDHNIVRFNGINRDRAQLKGLRKMIPFHVDGWRVNVAPGLWVPAYVYSEEVEDNAPQATPRIKSQVRYWGYNFSASQAGQEFTAIHVDEPTVRDEAAEPQQLSPVLAQRQWERQAEANVVERLSRAGLLAPPNGVDKVLETVVRNLQITNNIVLEEDVRCRILLTSPLESFTVGRTIVLSRGLIDVLPDEASLATMLAHELAHVVLGHQLIDTKFSFADRLMVPDDQLLGTVRFRHDLTGELAADAKVIELLKSSPYKDKLSEAGLFLRALTANALTLPNLIQPHIGEQLAGGKQFQRLSELMLQAPQLASERLDQIAALPLGARVLVDPWSGRLELLRTASVPLASPREKVPLAITPMVPYLQYAERPNAAASR